MLVKHLKKILIKGMVQGVGFRYFTYLEARKAGISGYVKNLSTGDVEIIALGEPDNLQRFIDAIKKGTPFSAIKSFIVTDLDLRKFPEILDNFQIIR